MAMIRDASGLLAKLLDGGHSTIVGRLAGAFRNSGRGRVADDIIESMTAAGFTVRETDPFTDGTVIALPTRATSPYVNRIRLLWQKMREPVIEIFPKAPGLPRNRASYLKRVDAAYLTDPYHSLSIEGYRVTPALIERVRGGAWNPDTNAEHREQHDAMAARGYWQASRWWRRASRRSSRARIRVQSPTRITAPVAERCSHRAWLRACCAGRPRRLSQPARIHSHSMHVPPNQMAVRDAMPAFFDLLRAEEHPAVRVVLGYFVFVYIHPYMDGNGRVGRFLMNLMNAATGYPWTVIPLEEHNVYMKALEKASVGEDIGPFAELSGRLIRPGLARAPLPAVPKA